MKLTKIKWRIRLWCWVCREVLKIPEGTMTPIKFLWLQYIFFPVDTYYTVKHGMNSIAIDYCNQAFMIYGKKYPMSMFERLSERHEGFTVRFEINHMIDGGLSFRIYYDKIRVDTEIVCKEIREREQEREIDEIS